MANITVLGRGIPDKTFNPRWFEVLDPLNIRKTILCGYFMSMASGKPGSMLYGQ